MWGNINYTNVIRSRPILVGKGLKKIMKLNYFHKYYFLNAFEIGCILIHSNEFGYTNSIIHYEFVLTVKVSDQVKKIMPT